MTNTLTTTTAGTMFPANAALPMPAEMQTRIDRLACDEKLDLFFTKKAEIMAKSRLMPPLFRGDVYACYALQQLAFQWEMSPALLAPGLYKVSEDAPLSLEGKTVKMILDRWAPVKDHFIADEYIGDWSKILGKLERKVSSKGNAYFVPGWKHEDEEGLGIILRAETLTGHKIEYRLMMSQCQTRNSTLWAEDPQLQLFYRAIARFARKYFPGILGGMMVKEELADGEVIEVKAVEVKPVPTSGSAADRLAEKLGAKKTPEKTPETAQESMKAAEPNIDKPPKGKPVSVLVCEELKKQGVEMTFEEFCKLLSTDKWEYDPDNLEETRPVWLMDKIPQLCAKVIDKKQKQDTKASAALL